tara:strand:- start:3059 stop:4147 length:1089 start_codon:yes stop_codon:yes gene_type:complete
MNQSRFLFIGALPDPENKHPGGQASATQGILDYCNLNDINVDIIDSAQNSFPFPSVYLRISRAIKRNLKLLFKLFRFNYNGIIIFCGEGFSFVEKSFSVFLCRIFRIKTVLSIRSGFFMDEIKSSKLKKNIYSLLLKLPNFHVVQGTKWKALLISLGIDQEKITIIPNWASAEFESSEDIKVATKKETIKFLYVGWMVKEKGVSHILEASQELEEKDSFEVYMVGGGTLYEELLKKANENSQENIKFLGWKNKLEVLRLMQTCHVLILPSYAEGFPNVVVEALSQNMPLITTDVGGIGDSSIDCVNSFIVKVGDTKDLFNSMQKFISDPSIIEEFSKNSYKIFNRRHRMERNCPKYFNIFQD